jgi:GNAT superfamily N-acetyltransferase
MIRSPERTPRPISDAYPAHLHVNLLPCLQGRGVGSELLRRWFVLARSRGANAVHVGVNRENTRGLRFWARSGFQKMTIAGEMGTGYDVIDITPAWTTRSALLKA